MAGAASQPAGQDVIAILAIGLAALGRPGEQVAGVHLVVAAAVAVVVAACHTKMPIGGLLGSRPIQTLLAPGDAYHSTAAVLAAVDAIASTCAASIDISSVGTAGEWPLKLVKLGADAPSKRRVLLTFGMHGREYQSAEIGLSLLTELCSGSERSQALLSLVPKVALLLPCAKPLRASCPRRTANPQMTATAQNCAQF